MNYMSNELTIGDGITKYNGPFRVINTGELSKESSSSKTIEHGVVNLYNEVIIY